MKEIELEKATLSLLSDNIVKMQIHDGAHLESRDIVQIHKAKLTMGGNEKHAVLLLSGKETTITKQAREISGHQDIGTNRKAKAIVVNSLAQRIIGNFFMRMQRSESKVKIFNTENEAHLWLNAMMAK